MKTENVSLEVIMQKNLSGVGYVLTKYLEASADLCIKYDYAMQYIGAVENKDTMIYYISPASRYKTKR